MRTPLRRLADRRRAVLRHENWNIGLADRTIGALADGAHARVRWVNQERGRWIADPFGHEEAGRHHLFFEVFDYRTQRGVIGHADITDNFESLQWETVLDTGSHISYPQILTDEGSRFLTVEAPFENETALYRAEDFPRGWVKHTVLLTETPTVDPTVFAHAGRWWLICTLGGDRDLHIWHASRLEGPWRPHSGNPVKSDSASARPAGRPFMLDGELYRPAQDCSSVYGARVVIQRIDALDERHYEETTVATIEPDPTGPFPGGLHTVSALGDSTLIDGKRWTFSVSAARHGLAGRTARLAARVRPQA
jgi:hypothetical protein